MSQNDVFETIVLESYIAQADLGKFLQREKIAEQKKQNKWRDEMYGLLGQPGVSEQTKARIREELKKVEK